jgi:phosphoenolpyruvate carboxylase
LANAELIRQYAALVEDGHESALFMEKLLGDYQKGFELLEDLSDQPAAIRRNGQYDNLMWRNDKLAVLHHLHIDYLQKWRNTAATEEVEKEKLLVQLLSIINALSSGLKNTG